MFHLGLLTVLMACQTGEPLSPLRSLEQIKVHAGYRVELVASEPLISDPVSIAFGPDQRLWVVEMRDYPSGDTSEGSGQIRILEDRDQDGRFDKSTVFLDHLEYPNSVIPWRDGAIVCCPPEIFFARDTDGDGLADERQVLFSGIAEGNPQHRVNGLKYGLDHWLYFANGDNGGVIFSEKTGEALTLGKYDVRLQPDDGRMDRRSGSAQFSRCRDDWGNWFGGNNSTPIWHVVLEDEDLRHGTHSLVARRREFIKDPLTELHTLIPDQRRLNQPEAVRRFTASCGLEIYRSSRLSDYTGCYIVCDPAHQLVHVSGLERHGATFRDRPLAAHSGQELLASYDPWFRPVQAKTGPDGAIWIVDMYRQTIEHPDYIPPRLHPSLNFLAGQGRGRIYRLVPIEEPAGSFIWPNLAQMSQATLLETLKSENGVLRDLAQQQLIERQDATMLPELTRLATEGNLPQTRLHALKILEHLEALPTSVLLNALSDTHPEVRRQAVDMCRGRWQSEPDLRKALDELREDLSAPVYIKLIGVLGSDDSSSRLTTLADIANRHGDKPFVRDAVLSINDSLHPELLEVLLSQPELNDSTGPLIGELLLNAYRNQDQKALKNGLDSILSSTLSTRTQGWQMAALSHWIRGLRQSNISLAALATRFEGSLKSEIEQLEVVLADAAEVALDDTATLKEREVAVALLGQFESRLNTDLEALTQLLQPYESPVLQSLAIEVLQSVRQPETGFLLLAGWSGQSPDLRNQVLEAILQRPDWTRILIDQLERGEVDLQSIGAQQRHRLSIHRFPDIRMKAIQLLGQTPADRKKVIEDYAIALTLNGSPSRGKLLYEKSCVSCHETATKAYPLAPHLSEVTRRAPEQFLIDILDPNRSIEPKYQQFTIATESGESVTGLIGADTERAISVIDSKGQVSIIPRETILSMQSGPSFMPEGLEKELSPQQMADLLAFVTQGL
jgi:putative membrane-bound dehydrogenase-like protein